MKGSVTIMPAANANTASKLAQSNEVVRKYMLIGLAPGILAYPLLSGVALAGIQLRMLKKISQVYGIEFSKELGKALIGTLVGSSLAPGLAIGLIPVVGQVVGAASMVVLGGASTYALGKVFIQHFESGGTLLTFDPDKMRAYYEHHAAIVAPMANANFAGVKP